MEFAPDGRLFVTQQGGALRVIKDGKLLSTPFLTLDVDSAGERGLLGIAFDPNFATNRFVYVYYTVPGSAGPPSVPAHNRVSRFTAGTGANADTAVAGSEHVLLDLNNLSSATNHNGGAIHFGPDGKLYISAGENANGTNAQNLGNLLGKILRINADGSIPGDNPFVSTQGARGEIWAYGLRNPFTTAFQPGTGRFFINDVGENAWEEIDDGIAGSNYGWPHSEGNVGLQQGDRAPLLAYGHRPECAIAGGAFYNPVHTTFGNAFVGKYFYADLCGGWIRTFDSSNSNVAGFATGLSSPDDLKVGPDGSLYYLMRGSGSNTGVVGRVKSNTDTDGDGYVDADEYLIGEDPTSRCATMRADVDGNGTVTILDLSTVATHFLEPVTTANARFNQDANATIDIIDLATMATHFLEDVSDCE